MRMTANIEIDVTPSYGRSRTSTICKSKTIEQIYKILANFNVRRAQKYTLTASNRPQGGANSYMKCNVRKTKI